MSVYACPLLSAKGSSIANSLNWNMEQMVSVHCYSYLKQLVLADPKISIFNTAQESGLGLHIATLPEVTMGNVGNVEKIFTFTMAWKRFCYLSEVSGLVTT